MNHGIFILSSIRHLSRRSLQVIIQTKSIRRATYHSRQPLHSNTFTRSALPYGNHGLMEVAIRVTTSTISLSRLQSITYSRTIRRSLFLRGLMMKWNTFINRLRNTSSVKLSNHLIKQRNRRRFIRTPRVLTNFSKAILYRILQRHRRRQTTVIRRMSLLPLPFNRKMKRPSYHRNCSNTSSNRSRDMRTRLPGKYFSIHWALRFRGGRLFCFQGVDQTPFVVPHPATLPPSGTTRPTPLTPTRTLPTIRPTPTLADRIVFRAILL